MELSYFLMLIHKGKQVVRALQLMKWFDAITITPRFNILSWVKVLVLDCLEMCCVAECRVGGVPKLNNKRGGMNERRKICETSLYNTRRRHWSAPRLSYAVMNLKRVSEVFTCALGDWSDCWMVACVLGVQEVVTYVLKARRSLKSSWFPCQPWTK